MNAFILVSILGVIAVFFAFLASVDKAWLKVTFFVIFAFLALRYNFGNDYKGYNNRFLEINGYQDIGVAAEFVTWEPGWFFLNRMFGVWGSSGFFLMVALLAAFNCFVYYLFIKRYVPPSYYWFAVFLYIFTPGLMLVHSSAMRQSVAIALFLLAIDFLCRKKILLYFLCLTIAITFHKSAVVLVPIYLLTLIKWEIKTTFAIAAFMVFAGLFIFGDIVLVRIVAFTEAYFPKYEYSGGHEVRTGLGVIFQTFQMAVILYFARFKSGQYVDGLVAEHQENSFNGAKSDILPAPVENTVLKDKQEDILFKLGIVTFMFIPLGLQLYMLSRINMYFQPAMLVVYPLVLARSQDMSFKILFFGFTAFYILFSFWIFFQSQVWREAFGTYQIILQAF